VIGARVDVIMAVVLEAMGEAGLVATFQPARA
jgi:hypothetical protein